MLDSLSTLKDKFSWKFLKPAHESRIVDERADTEQFKHKIKERLVKAIIKGVNALPIVVANKGQTIDANEIAHKGNGFYVHKIQYLRRSVYHRSVFYHITREFPITYTDEAAAIMDAFFQETRLQQCVEDLCSKLIDSIPDEKLENQKDAFNYLKHVFTNRLTMELEEFFEKHQLLLLCVARGEGIKSKTFEIQKENGEVDSTELRNILDKRNYKAPIFDDQYENMRSHYKLERDVDEEKPFE